VEFDGFSSKAFAWFDGIEENNNRDWFQANRDTYESEVRGPLEAMLTELCDDFGGDLKLFRQNRDVRFSHDKSPYKTRTYGLIAGRAGSETGLYAELSSEGLYAGSGYHEFAPDQLTRFREAVDDARKGPALERAVEKARAAGLEVGYESLKTAPRGYAKDHPRVALLRHKILVAGARLAGSSKRGMSGDRVLEHCRSTWKAAKPMTDWLDKHVGPSTLSREERFGRGR
jgi:uncharacterized protein (TIGR02453 family)